MFKFLSRYIFFSFIKHFILVALLFLPMLYLADFFLQDSFTASDAINKLLFRYGQIINLLCLFSMYSAVTSLKNKHGDIAFLSVGFDKKMGFKVIVFASFFINFFYFFIVIPSNDYFFPRKVHITDWSILDKKDRVIYFYKNKKGNEVWVYNKVTKKIYITKSKSSLKSDDFYIIWNEPKKLSFKGLNECQNYMKEHNFNYDDLIKQRHAFLAKMFLVFAMILCGYTLAWRGSFFLLFLCCIVSNWIDQISIFIPTLTLSISMLWINVLIWCTLGICGLYFF